MRVTYKLERGANFCFPSRLSHGEIVNVISIKQSDVCNNFLKIAFKF